MGNNCWEFKGCGFGPESAKEDGRKICPAASHKNADGFLAGENGGRACHFILGTLCCGLGPQSDEEKKARCRKCDFFVSLQEKHGKSFSYKNFLRYVINSENRIFC
jgi:hypothetical protein